MNAKRRESRKLRIIHGNIMQAQVFMQALPPTVSRPDPLLENGYQIKIRWVGDGAATLWMWANFFSTLTEAQDYKTKHQGETEPGYGWKLEIEIFEIKRVEA